MVRDNPDLQKQASIVGGGEIPKHEPQQPTPATDDKLREDGKQDQAPNTIKGDTTPNKKG